MCGNDFVKKELFVFIVDVDVIFVEEECNDGFVVVDDDCGWWDEFNIGVDVEVDWFIIDKVGDSVDGNVLVFVDVVDSDVVFIREEEEEEEEEIRIIDLL